MIRRGCLLGLLCFVAIFAIYGVALGRYFEWPENLVAAGFAGIFGAMGLGGMSNILWAWRDDQPHWRTLVRRLRVRGAASRDEDARAHQRATARPRRVCDGGLRD
jgi:hypothetical protein